MAFWWYLIAGAAGAAAGLFVAIASTRVSKGLGVGAGVIAGIAIALVVQAVGQTFATSSATAGYPSEAATMSEPSTTSESTAPEDGSSTSPAPEEPSSVPETTEPTTSSAASDEDQSTSGRYYLADVRRVETEKEGRVGGCTGGCTGFKGGSGRIGGEVFPQSYLMGVAADGRRSTAVWNSVNSCSVLDVTVGLDDSSTAAQVTFAITKDDAAPEVLGTTTLGRSIAVESSLDGVARFQLAAYVSGSEASDEVRVVWGDAVMTCRPGSIVGG